FKALNDGILGFGGSTDQVNEAVIQLSQSFSNGKVDAQTWNSMINAQLGPTLSAIAKKMGITMGDLKEGLSQGKISVEEFQNQLIEMDTKGGGGLKSLSQIAKDSTKGIKTSIQNAKTAVTRGVGEVIEGLNKALVDSDLGGFKGIIDKVG
ncbi:tape measure protein, partial [Enterococcus faecium]|nr:tape measure protein [Enterococcus faecium]